MTYSYKIDFNLIAKRTLQK